MSAIGRKLSSGGVVYGGTRKLAYCLNGIRKNCICFGRVRKIGILMGEGFILFNKGLRIYGGVYHPPFDTLKIGTYTDDIKLKLYR